MRKFLTGISLLMLIIGLVVLLKTNQSPASAATTTTYRKYLGVVMSGSPYTTLPAVEQKVGRKYKRFLWYQNITQDFDIKLAKWLYSRGTYMQVSWEPRDPTKDPVNQPAYSLNKIRAGNHDAAIRRWARQIKSFGKTVYFRPMCEMNGPWTSWSGGVNGNRPYEYIYAWRRVYNIFQQEGATNAKFVWSPNRDGSYTSAKRTFDSYYPGKDYVQYVGINGYNWGSMYKTSSWTSVWQNWDEVFKYSYTTFARNTSKPMIIAETATTEKGGNKAQWITHKMIRLRYAYPRVRQVYWFNLNKETDWRIDSSTASLNAYKTYSKYHN